MKNGLQLKGTAFTGQSAILFVKDTEEKTKKWADQASDWTVKKIGSSLVAQLISPLLRYHQGQVLKS